MVKQWAKPKVIFLDAVGTLFGVRGSVGDRYSQVAQQFGVVVAPEILDQAFRDSFRRSVPPAFAGVTRAELPEREFEWWEAIARQTFGQAGVLAQFPDFRSFFRALYADFQTAAAWVVYPDVVPMLTQWRSQEIELGIISNFDTRLYPVLDALELTPFFSNIILSTEVGAAKPDPLIFSTALQKFGCLPAEAWHIGDSEAEDYQGAIQVGLAGFWLQRSDDSVPLRSTRQVHPAQPETVWPEFCLQSLSDLVISDPYAH